MVVQEGWIPDSSGMTDGQVGDGGGVGVVRLWGLGLHSVLSVRFWVGDGRSGTRMQNLDGTYADAGGIGGVLPYPHSCLGRLAGVEGVPGWGIPSCISARPLSGTAFDSIPSWAERSPRTVTAVEPRRGSRALIPETPGRRISPASQCQRHRRPNTGSTDSAEAPGKGCTA